MSVKPVLLGLYETYYLPLGKTLKPGLQGLLTGVLPGLEEGSEYYDRLDEHFWKIDTLICALFYGPLGECISQPDVEGN